MNKRINFLDGLRGIFALTVFLSHFIHCFLVGYVNVDNLYRLPFMIFADGNVAVRYFFVLCGFTITLQLINRTEEKAYMPVLIKKYFRLAIPCLIINIIAYTIKKSGAYCSIEASEILHAQSGHLFRQNPIAPPIYQIFTESFITDIFVPLKKMGKMLVPPLWTMSYEYVGSVMICIFYIFVSKIKILKEHRRQICIILILLFGMTSDILINTYFQYFFIGNLFAELYKDKDIKQLKDFYIYPLLILAVCIISAGMHTPPPISKRSIKCCRGIFNDFLRLFGSFYTKILQYKTD